MKINIKPNASVIESSVAAHESRRAPAAVTNQPVIVQIAELERRLGTLQMRAGLNEDHVENDLRPKIRDDVKLKAVTVVRLVDGRLLLVDGFHRVEAFTREGILGIEAVVIDGDEEKAFDLALVANDDHGLPLSNEDKAHKLHKAVERWKGEIVGGQMSYQDLAKRTRLSLTFVHKHVSAMGISPDDVRWVKRGDSVYAMKVEGIGRKATAKSKTSKTKGGEKSPNKVTLTLTAVQAQALRAIAEEMPELYADLRRALLGQLPEE